MAFTITDYSYYYDDDLLGYTSKRPTRMDNYALTRRRGSLHSLCILLMD